MPFFFLHFLKIIRKNDHYCLYWFGKYLDLLSTTGMKNVDFLLLKYVLCHVVFLKLRVSLPKVPVQQHTRATHRKKRLSFGISKEVG